MKFHQFALCTALTTSGISPTANYVSQKSRESRLHIEKSQSLGAAFENARQELCKTFDERCEPNWDGFGALPVTQDTYTQAYRFVEALPLGKCQPTIGAEPDGQITLEWHRGPYQTLSVSVSPDGDLHYSALIGPNKSYGTEAFFGDVPRTILDLIDRVCVG
jgi:hypothetical protein